MTFISLLFIALVALAVMWCLLDHKKMEMSEVSLEHVG